MKRRRESGQSLVEFSFIVTVLLILVLGAAEMGLALQRNMSLVAATREGARVGAALGNGAHVGATNVDPLIIAAVERVFQSTGIDESKIDFIDIYKSNGSGAATATTTNHWTYTPGAGPLNPGDPTHTQHLNFTCSGTNWAASSRSAASPTDSIGVKVQYRYQMLTPLGALTDLFATKQFMMNSSTIMAIEP